MVVVERSIEIAASQREAFEFVADYGNVRGFMHNIRRFDPIGSKAYGLGARFYWETVVRGLRLGWQFVVTEFVPHEWMAARSLALPRSSSKWRFGKVEGGTTASFSVALDLPAGLLPPLVGRRFVEQELARNIERSLVNLRGQLEEISLAKRLSVAGGERLVARR